MNSVLISKNSDDLLPLKLKHFFYLTCGAAIVTRPWRQIASAILCRRRRSCCCCCFCCYAVNCCCQSRRRSRVVFVATPLRTTLQLYDSTTLYVLRGDGFLVILSRPSSLSLLLKITVRRHCPVVGTMSVTYTCTGANVHVEQKSALFLRLHRHCNRTIIKILGTWNEFYNLNSQSWRSILTYVFLTRTFSTQYRQNFISYSSDKQTHTTENITIPYTRAINIILQNKIWILNISI